MKIIGIETSCDDTAVAVLGVKRGNYGILSSVVSSQVKIHAEFGGIVPNLAAREHEKNLPAVLKLALKKAGVKNVKEVDFISVTKGPGLAPALWCGINFAKKTAEKYKKPLIGVNHLEGHIYSNWLKPAKKITKKVFPALNLIVSGGHTMLVLMKDYGKYKVIGETLDDAAGEAFDKVARLLNLGYPGGPIISKRAGQFNSKKKQIIKIGFPRPMKYSKNYNFSYSGLKTAVFYKLKGLEKEKIKLTKNITNQISYEFQKAAIDVLVHKTKRAAQEFKVKSLMLSGGVSANTLLRSELKNISKEVGIEYFQPDIKYTTDNAAMIVLAGYFNYQNKKVALNTTIEARPNLGL